MRVEDAKKKVCTVMSNHVITGAGDIILATVNCICGDCMEWQFQKELETKKFERSQHPQDFGSYISVKTIVDCEEDTGIGYCKRIGK